MRRYIREAAVSYQQAASQGLALFNKDGRFVLYDPNGMLRALQTRNPEEQSYSEMDAALANNIYGYIELADVPRGEAWGASMVRQSAAKKGYGPFMYDIALTLAGSIVSDREKVSPAAEKVWQGYQKRSDVKKYPLDDITDPQTPTEVDDGDVFQGRDALNYAYSGANVNAQSLKSNHEKFLSSASSIFDGDKSYVDDALEAAADAFFRRMY